jgi:GGDEF domain-containing protein
VGRTDIHSVGHGRDGRCPRRGRGRLRRRGRRPGGLGEYDAVRGQERVTASIGVAAFDPAAQVSSADVITAADAAMRRAKDEGRDRIVIAGV